MVIKLSYSREKKESISSVFTCKGSVISAFKGMGRRISPPRWGAGVGDGVGNRGVASASSPSPLPQPPQNRHAAANANSSPLRKGSLI